MTPDDLKFLVGLTLVAYGLILAAIFGRGAADKWLAGDKHDQDTNGPA